MRRFGPDRIDLKILKELQEEGRTTNVDLAGRVGISAPPCLRRVHALEEAGYIKGYRACIDVESLGYKVVFFALVGLVGQSEAMLTEFGQYVSAWDEVRECCIIRGPYDFLLRIVARDIAHENRLTSDLTEAPHVSTLKTLQVVRHEKEDVGVSIDIEALSLLAYD